MKKLTAAGLSLRGGRRDNFFFCLLESFENSDKIFLKSLLKVEDADDSADGDYAIKKWVDDFNLKDLALDFPISEPPCIKCTLDCPGKLKCVHHDVVEVRSQIDKILSDDEKLQTENPKEYERERNRDDEFDYSKNILAKENTEYIISRAFKRRLKKGFLPYWNRPVDLFVWKNYYDQMLSIFGQSYDSFGNTSLMLSYRAKYIKKHFTQSFDIYEANIYLVMIEFLKAKKILKRDLLDFLDIEKGVDTRFKIISMMEQEFKVFVYDEDLETLIKNPRAFQSYILAFVAQMKKDGKCFSLPSWTKPDEAHLLIPDFS